MRPRVGDTLGQPREGLLFLAGFARLLGDALASGTADLTARVREVRRTNNRGEEQFLVALAVPCLRPDRLLLWPGPHVAGLRADLQLIARIVEDLARDSDRSAALRRWADELEREPSVAATANRVDQR